MRFITDVTCHYRIELLENRNFYVALKDKYLCVVNLSGVYHINLSNNLKVEFTNEDGFLKCMNFYVEWKRNSDNLIVLFLELLKTEKTVRLEPDVFDVEHYIEGGQNFLFYPGLYNKDLITRVSFNLELHGSIPKNLYSKFKKFCLLPKSSTNTHNVIIEEYDFCENNVIKYMSDLNLVEFLQKFRKTWTALAFFKKENFFHGDIATKNLIIDNGELKFIDFDLSFCFPNVPENHFLKTGYIVGIYPVIPHFLMSRFIQESNNLPFQICEDDQSHIQIQKRFFRENFPKSVSDVLIDNLTKYELQKFSENFSDLTYDVYLNILHYISIYQLAVVFAHLVTKQLQKNTQNPEFTRQILNFVGFCVNFKKYGFIGINSVISKYDELVFQITELSSN